MKPAPHPRQLPLIAPGLDPVAQAQIAAAGRAQAQMLQANALRAWGRAPNPADLIPSEPAPTPEPSGARVFRQSLPGYLAREAAKAAAEAPASDALLDAARAALGEADAELAAVEAATMVDALDLLADDEDEDDLPLIDPELIPLHDPSEDLPGIFPPRNPAA